MIENRYKYIALLIFVIVFTPIFTFAKDYKYRHIDVTLRVNTNGTVDVREELTMDFNGEFHKGWRAINLKDLDSISDITVLDANGNPFTYSSKKQNKTSPKHWGKYTTYKQDGAQVVEWYYPATVPPQRMREHSISGEVELDKNKTNWQQTFTILYTVHGALNFYKDKDELYWNLFTDYAVPVDGVSWQVLLPSGVIQTPHATVYTSNNKYYQAQVVKDASGYIVKGEIADTLPPHANVTVAVGWQKGVVNRMLAQLRELPFFIMATLSIALCVGGVGYTLWFWVTHEYLPSRGTIIPEYEPPLAMTPAEMRAVYDEHAFSKKIIPATMIAMATRGDAVIKEEERTGLKKLSVFTKHYTIHFNQHRKGWSVFERALVDYLLKYGAVSEDVFSTRMFKKQTTSSITGNQSGARAGLKHLQGLLMSTISSKYPQLYEVSPSPRLKASAVKNRFDKILIMAVIVMAVFMLAFAVYEHYVLNRSLHRVVFMTVAAFLGFMSIFLVRRDARFNKEGNDVYRAIKGFKLYLSVAERYRVQNLTQETFERFLPYAMIFGIEKKWARAFDVLHVQISQPQWYTGSRTISGSTFSASAFSRSCVSSLNSAFASSGVSGGGGIAGGGSGGGGGGAS